MLEVVKNQAELTIETGSARFSWDLRRGGQIVRLDLKSPAGYQPLLADGAAVPNLTLETPDRQVSLADQPVEVEFGRQDTDCVIFNTTARIGDLFTFTQQFEVFPEGVVFCEFGLMLEQGHQAVVRNAQMDFPLAVTSAKNLRTSYVSRDPSLKQDVTCIHVLTRNAVDLDRNTPIDEPQLLAMCGLDLGWQESRYFSNRLEIAIEDSTSIGGDMMGPTGTIAGPRNGAWHLTWKLCQDCSDTLSAPFLYRNRWAILCGAARTEAGLNAEPARRNNVLASRICHVMYPYVRQGHTWPWVSVPTKQVFYQDSQIAKENPSLDRIDEAAALGANILILHQFWMTNAGSNGEPMADYTVHDPKWFKAFIDKAHKKGMRVGVYTRGVEHYSLFMDFFEKYLQRDWDGLYVDWASPFALGFTKTSSKHCSLHNWFTFSRALRKRVGPGGFLIGHTIIQTYSSYALFDAALTGEFSVMHSGLLAEPQTSTSYGMLGGCGVHLIAGNAPDREIFSSQQAAAYSAGLGYSNHPFMEPGKDFADCNAFIQPVWDLWRSLPSEPVRVFNPAVGTGDPLSWTDDNLHPMAYQTADRTTLVLVTNLGQKPVSGTVEIDFEALGLSSRTKMQPLNVSRTHPLKVDQNKVIVENMPSYSFGGLLAR